MNDVNTIHELNYELKRVAALHQWVRLLDVDQKIATLLQDFRQRDDLEPEVVDALKGLLQSHKKTIDYCRQEQAILESKMKQHQTNLEGMAAYASVGFDEEE